MVLDKTLENPLYCKEIQPVHPQVNQSWMFTGRTDVEAETPILWPPDANTWLIGKDPDDGKDWRREEKGTTEDKMVGWHHWLSAWVWVSSRSWWWTGRPGVLQSTGLQRVRHNWATELNWMIKYPKYYNVGLRESTPNLPKSSQRLKNKIWGHACDLSYW